MKQAISFGIYKLQNGDYQTSYTDPVQQKRIRKKFKSYKKAMAYERAVQHRHGRADFNAHSSTPVINFIPDYLEKHPEAKMASRSLYIYKSFIDTFGQTAIGDVNKRSLVEWLQKIKTDKDYSARTMVLIKYCFTPFFTYLVEEGVLGENPLAKVKLNRHGPRKLERVILAETELKEILDGLKNKGPLEIYPVAYFQIHTGTRIGEALDLTWTQVDLEKGTVRIVASANGDERILNIPQQLLTLLQSLPRTSEYVFTQHDGQPWTQGKYCKVFTKIRTQILFKKNFNSYAFRHSFAYHFLRKGGSLQHLQVILGHRSIDMTKYLYGTVNAKDVEKTTPYNF